MKWSKSYPEAADRFAVSITDTDSPTGFSWASKTDAEVKSLLGLPSKVYKAWITTNGIGQPTVTVIKNSFSGDISITRSNVGRYSITSTDEEFTENKTLVLITLIGSDGIVYNSSISTSIVGVMTFAIGGSWQDDVPFSVSVEVY